MASPEKYESNLPGEHPYSINARRCLNDLIFRHNVKAEWLAKVCQVTPQGMSLYRNGERPIPVHVAVLVDQAFGGNDMLNTIAAMEGVIIGEVSA